MLLASRPKGAIAAVQKACFSDEAFSEAIRVLPFVPNLEVVATMDGPPVVAALGDGPATWRCDLCDYACGSSKQLGVHSRITHGSRHPINKCVDTTHCTVCSIDMHTTAGILEHLLDKSPECRLNLLLRGEFVTDEDAERPAVEAAAISLSNFSAGHTKHFADLVV